MMWLCTTAGSTTALPTTFRFCFHYRRCYFAYSETFRIFHEVADRLSWPVTRMVTLLRWLPDLLGQPAELPCHLQYLCTTSLQFRSLPFGLRTTLCSIFSHLRGAGGIVLRLSQYTRLWN